MGKVKAMNENINAQVKKNEKYNKTKKLKFKGPQPQQAHSKNKDKNKIKKISQKKDNKIANSNKNKLSKTKSTQQKFEGNEEKIVKSNNLSSKLKDKNIETLPTANESSPRSKTTNAEKNERTVFIGNLPSNVKKNQLKNLLLPFGKMVKCRFRLPQLGKPILKHKMAANSDSLNAYVELSDRSEVINSLKLNGTNYRNHHLRVSESIKKFDSSSIDQNQAKRTVFVGNLKYEANDELLYEVFSTCGDIEYCRTLNNEKGCKGVAYVCFVNLHSVGLAIELNGTLINDRPIKVIKYSINKIQENSSKINKYNGVVRRIGRKLGKNPKELLSNKKKLVGNSNIEKYYGEAENKPKIDKKIKLEFQGVHVNSKKKCKPKFKKNQCKDLANKIAPK